MAITLKKFVSNFAKKWQGRGEYKPHPDETHQYIINGKPVDEDTYYEKLGEIVETSSIGGGGIRRG